MMNPATPGGAVVTGTPTRSMTGLESRSFVLTLLALLSLLACADSSVTSVTTEAPTANSPSLEEAQLEVLSGDAQQGTAGSYLSEPLVVRVLNGEGQPYADALVEWGFVRGAGRAGSGQPARRFTTLTGDDGTASVEWQLSPRAGVQSATASLPAPSTVAGLEGLGAASNNGNGKNVGFGANAKPGDVAYVSVTPSEATVRISSSLQIEATGIDHYGNRIDGLSFQWGSSDEDVATVSGDGLVYTYTEGSAGITAKYKSVDGTASLTASTSTDNLAPSVSIVEPLTHITVLLGEETYFQGSATDADGSVVSHRWTFGDGNGASVEDPGAYTYSTEGVYTVTYEATDDQAATSSASRVVTVSSSVNAPPSATILEPSEEVSVSAGEAVEFQGNATDADGTVVAHAWDFGDGTTASTASPEAHSYEAEGIYTVTYQVTDDDGAVSSPESATITVSSTANQAPTASIDSPSTDVTVSVGEAVDFRGSASDSDGTIVSHRWSFGDGGTSSSEAPGSYSYQSVGTYSVTYEVTDDDSATGSAGRTVTVTANDPSGAPTFLFNSDWSTTTGTSSMALLDASKERQWDAEKGDGNGGVAVTETVLWPDGIINALTVAHVDGNDNPGVRLDRSLPRFTSGTRGYRVYFKNVLPDAHAITSDRHPWQDAAGGSNTNWEFNVTVDETGAYAPYFELGGSCPDCEGTQWHRWSIGGAVQRDASAMVPKDSVYRFEFLLTHHPTGDSVDIEIKMYNADGSVRVDSDEWKRVSDGQSSSVVSWYAFDPVNKDNLQDLQIGTNGWGGGTTETPYVTWHWAALAVCDDWCGPYGNGGVEGN